MCSIALWSITQIDSELWTFFQFTQGLINPHPNYGLLKVHNFDGFTHCMSFIQILSIQTLKFRSLKRVLRKYDFEFNVSVTSQNSKFLKIIEINLLEHAAKFGCGLHFYWYPPVSEASGDEANFIKTKTCTV